MKYVLMFAYLTTFSQYLFGQKKFEVTLSFPIALDLTKLNILVDNGFGRNSVPYKITKDNQVTLWGVYYSRYAAIVLRYPKTENWNYGNFFFLDSKPARIKFSIAAKDSSPFENYSLLNAYDFKKERDSMDAYVATETSEQKNYLNKYGSMLFDGKHQDLQDRFFELDQNVYKKLLITQKQRVTHTSRFGISEVMPAIQVFLQIPCFLFLTTRFLMISKKLSKEMLSGNY